jgi:hypothetical protein
MGGRRLEMTHKFYCINCNHKYTEYPVTRFHDGQGGWLEGRTGCNYCVSGADSIQEIPN